MTRDEWKRRYADRIMELAKWSEASAMEAAEVAAQEYEIMGDWSNPEDPERGPSTRSGAGTLTASESLTKAPQHAAGTTCAIGWPNN